MDKFEVGAKVRFSFRDQHGSTVLWPAAITAINGDSYTIKLRGGGHEVTTVDKLTTLEK